MIEIRNLIHLYMDGNEWCAIYPMGSDLMTCEAVAFNPINIVFNERLESEVDCGGRAAIKKVRDQGINCPVYCEERY